MKKVTLSFIKINQETYYGLSDISELIPGLIDIEHLNEHIVSIKFFDNSSDLKYISNDGIELLAESNQDISSIHKTLQRILSENQIDMKHHLITLYV